MEIDKLFLSAAVIDTYGNLYFILFFLKIEDVL